MQQRPCRILGVDVCSQISRVSRTGLSSTDSSKPEDASTTAPAMSLVLHLAAFAINNDRSAPMRFKQLLHGPWSEVTHCSGNREGRGKAGLDSFWCLKTIQSATGKYSDLERDLATPPKSDFLCGFK